MFWLIPRSSESSAVTLQTELVIPLSPACVTAYACMIPLQVPEVLFIWEQSHQVSQCEIFLPSESQRMSQSRQQSWLERHVSDISSPDRVSHTQSLRQALKYTKIRLRDSTLEEFSCPQWRSSLKIIQLYTSEEKYLKCRQRWLLGITKS